MTTQRARIAKVIIAEREVECLMMPNGEFRIAVSQVHHLLPKLITQNNATREVKALLGKDSHYSSTERVASELHSKTVQTITLDQFTRVLIAASKKGDVTASEMCHSLVGASLASIVSSAFGIKFTQEQLTQWVEARDTHKKTFPLLTRWLKEDGCDNYGKAVNIFKAKAGLPRLTVDDYTKDELFQANASERMYDRLRIKGMEHDAALELL
jgi:hypothetical protein